MNTYDILVSVHYPEGFKHRTQHPTLKIGYLVKASTEVAAKAEALNLAKATQARHPQKYKGCTFTVNKQDIKIFTM